MLVKKQIMNNGKYLVDTNVIIAFLGGDRYVADKLYCAEEVYISVIVVGELLYGVFCSKNVAENMEKIQQFVSAYTILNLDIKTAENYANIKHKLKEKGKLIPENDIWISAQSVQYGLTLCSRDEHFEVIEDIKLEKWLKKNT